MTTENERYQPDIEARTPTQETVASEPTTEPLVELIVQAAEQSSVHKSPELTRLEEFLRAALEHTQLFPLLTPETQDFVFTTLAGLLPRILSRSSRPNDTSFGYIALKYPIKSELAALTRDIAKKEGAGSDQSTVNSRSVAPFITSVFKKLADYLVLGQVVSNDELNRSKSRRKRHRVYTYKSRKIFY